MKQKNRELISLQSRLSELKKIMNKFDLVKENDQVSNLANTNNQMADDQNALELEKKLKSNKTSANELFKLLNNESDPVPGDENDDDNDEDDDDEDEDNDKKNYLNETQLLKFESDLKQNELEEHKK